MKTMHSDFAAFKARLMSPEAAHYERRDEPSPGATAEVIEQLAEGFEGWKKKHDTELSELRGTVDRLETRLRRPGALADPAVTDDAQPAEWRLNGQPVRMLRTPADIRAHYQQRAAADRGIADQPRVGMAEFMRAVAGGSVSPETRAVVSVGTDADGGYAVPTRLMQQILEALVPASAVMQAGAGILDFQDSLGESLRAGAKSFKVAAVDTIPTAAWRNENGTIAESSPGFRVIEMTPRSLAFFVKISREWLMDSVAGADGMIVNAAAQAIAKEIDRAALRGSGTAPEPRGLLNTSGINTVANGANGASLATTRYANLFSATQLILEDDAPMPTAAIMSPRSRVTLGALADTTNQPLQVPEMLRSMRMLATSQVPNNLTVGTSTDCSEVYVGDFRWLVYALRENFSVQRVDQLFATSGQVGFIFHSRIDVGVLHPKAFAVVTGVRP